MDTAVVPAESHATGALGDDRWRVLFRSGAVAAMISALFIPIQIVVFLTSDPPLDGTAGDWFALLAHDRLVGLIDLDLLLVADNVVLIPILLALFVVLRRTQASVMLLATAFGLSSVAMYIATNPAVGMASLADAYARAPTAAERASALGAAETLLATWQGTGVPRGVPARLYCGRRDRCGHAALRRVGAADRVPDDPRQRRRARALRAGRRGVHLGLLGPLPRGLVFAGRRAAVGAGAGRDGYQTWKCGVLTHTEAAPAVRALTADTIRALVRRACRRRWSW
ncbi:MAG TPA: hypothetical protein VGJ53_11355 [Micromonosporaceae bacterium]